MIFQERFNAEFKSIKNPDMLAVVRDLEVFEVADSYGIFDPLQTMFVGNSVATSDVLNLFSRSRASHYINLDPESYLRSLITAGAMLRRPGRFLQSPLSYLLPDLDSLERAAGPAALRTFPVPFQSNLDRPSVLSRIGEFLEGHRSTKGSVEPVLTIIDEMVTNALQATIDDNGRRVHSRDTATTDKLAMGKDKLGRLCVAHDAQHLVVICEDPYGSLDATTFLDLLRETFDPIQQEEGMVSTGALGCKLMIDNCYEFVVISRRNIRTVVGCVLRLGHVPNHLDRQQSKNFHFHFF